MRRKPTSRPPHPPAPLAVTVAALAALVGATSVPVPAAAAGHGQRVTPQSIPPRHATSCGDGTATAVFAKAGSPATPVTRSCAGHLGLLSATLPEAPAHLRSEGQLAAAPDSGTTAADQLPAQGAALAGLGLVLLGVARHIRQSR